MIKISYKIIGKIPEYYECNTISDFIVESKIKEDTNICHNDNNENKINNNCDNIINTDNVKDDDELDYLKKMLIAIEEEKSNNCDEEKNTKDVEKNISEESKIKNILKKFTRNMNIEKLKMIVKDPKLLDLDSNIYNHETKLNDSNSNILLNYFMEKLKFKCSSERNNQISNTLSKIAMDNRCLNLNEVLNKNSEINKKYSNS